MGLLFAVALVSIGLVAATEVWVAAAKRQKLEELDWIGDQFVGAIGSYYESSPGSVKVYPRSLEELLEDRRFLTTKRHLRMVYRNPFELDSPWRTILSPDGGVAGIVVRPGGNESAPREYVYKPVVLIPR